MQPLGRFLYLIYGVLLMAAKFGLDAAASHYFKQPWTPLIYWSPMNLRWSGLEGAHSDYLLTLALISIPFTAIGIWLTARRLRTLELGIWLCFLFFLPVVNLIFFFFLVCSSEARGSTQEHHFKPRGDLSELFASSGIAAGCACAAVGLSITGFQSYGWGVFFAIPFGVGVITTLILSRNASRSFGYCVAASLFSLGLCGATLLAIAFEGVVCLLMSVPLAVPLAILGVFVAREIVRPGPNQVPTQAAMFAFWMVLICPLSAANDRIGKSVEELVMVTTAVEIDAAPERVWGKVVAFPDLPPAREWIFRAGIAYPVRARIEGHGEGAIRYCEFSTGPFVEPVTAWQEPSLLAFNVTSSPAPMQEWSPYDIHPPHLDGFLQSKRGQFRLIPLDGGRKTRLEGSTWYQQSLYPAAYWRLWTDWIIHQIHLRVLRHIQVLAEDGTRVGLN